MVDREKVLAVLLKRFPEGAANDIAAAANAIVGLGAEYTPITPAELVRFDCDTGRHVYAMRHVTNGDVRVFRRKLRD
jgi:hypothetical protein